MPKKIDAKFLRSLQRKNRMQEAIRTRLKDHIVRVLSLSYGIAVRFYALRESLVRELGIPEELESAFSDDFKVAIEALHRDRVLLNSWNASQGGFLVYPYKVGMEHVLARAGRVETLHRLSMSVQHGSGS